MSGSPSKRDRVKSFLRRPKSSERNSSLAANTTSTSLHGNSHSAAPQLLTKVSSNSLRTNSSVNDNATSQSSENLSSSHSLSLPLAVQPSVSPSPNQSSTSNSLPAIIISPSVPITEAAPGTTATEQIPETPTPPLNLWNYVFENVNEETKKWIRTHHLNSTEHSQPGSQIQRLAALLDSKTLADDKDTPSNIVIGDHTIVVRDYVQTTVNALRVIGDVAMNFAPPMANAPWAAVKVLLNVPLKNIEQKVALAGTTELFTRAVQRGWEYELMFTEKNTSTRLLSNLRGALKDLYIAAMELLARSDELFRKGTFKQILNTIVQPNQATELTKKFKDQEKRVATEVLGCQAYHNDRNFTQLGQTTQDTLKKVNEMARHVERFEEKGQDKLEKIMDFISPPQYGKGHSDFSESRIKGTGDWLIKHKSFCKWEALSPAVFCLEGNSGTGKTYLTSRVIDHLKEDWEISSNNDGFAFFYCHRSGSSMQDPVVVLRSFVRQLAYRQNYGDVPKSVIQTYKKAKNEGRNLSYKECRELISELLSLYLFATIVLDALDECDTEKHSLAETLLDLKANSTTPLRIFISSRPDRGYLAELERKSTIKINSDDQLADIKKYLHEKLYSTPLFKSRPMNIRRLVEKTFKTHNGGMFRWVYLQVRRLSLCISDDAVKTWAQTIPDDLMKAYDQIWDKLKKDRECDMPLIERAIKWVLGSPHPIGTEHLLTAIRYTIEGDALVEKERQARQHILSLCQDFLTIDGEKQVWMLPHASVAEYFESKSQIWGNSDAFVANIKLKILMEPEEDAFDIESHKDDPDYPEFCTGYTPFRHYFMNDWPEDVQRYDRWLGSTEGATPDAQLAASLRQFLGAPEERSTYYIKWCKGRYSYSDGFKSSDICWLAMCRYGFYNVLRDWWKNYVDNRPVGLINVKYKAIELAAKGGCIEACECLLSTIDKNDSAQLKPAMANAVREGRKDVILLLTTQGGLEGIPYFFEKPDAIVDAALHPGLIQWLGDQELFVAWHGSYLLEAARMGNLQAVKDLLEAKADVNHRPEHAPRFGSALAVAVTSAFLQGTFEPDRVKIIKLLLKNRADPNLQLFSGKTGSALESTIYFYCEPKSHEERAKYGDAHPNDVLEILLEAGADPAMLLNHGSHGSALAAAAYRGLKDMLIMMVKVIGKGKAIECLRQSRRPEQTLVHRFDKRRESREATIAYLTDNLGVDRETLHKIGLWQDDPKEVGTFEGNYFKYKATQKPSIQNPSIQKPSIQKPSIQKPSIQKPSIQKPSIQKPSIQKPIIQKPITPEPITPEPIIQGPIIQEQNIECQKSNTEEPKIQELKNTQKPVLQESNIEEQNIERQKSNTQELKNVQELVIQEPNIEGQDIEGQDVERQDIQKLIIYTRIVAPQDVMPSDLLFSFY
ncbi:ANK_REP_REGION domain-containing protein [Trichoderma simmonsii]|uniref:ANK_REP_REGION domain-containing protein n=1 Tax=Trichoderma simmonsii TaxID=1491479 RepID=A0A8G0PM05_9HYPO|nr:ANK_REP_REGION domain-containing protein [Trichoderma simmonsii]